MSIPKALRRLIRPTVLEMEGYKTVTPVEDIARSINRTTADMIKLDQNENPYGTSLSVQEALSSFDFYHYYPDTNQTIARQKISEYAGAPFERIVVGNGSNELIDLILMTVIEPGDEIIVPMPSFGMYLTRPPVFGGVVKTVPRTPEFDLDLDAIDQAVTDRTKVIFITNPNNPTGNMVTSQQLVRILRTGALVVLDEAYYEFAGKTLLPLSREFDNMVVLRTFSKWAGLAGMRLGYGIFPAKLVDQIWKVKSPFNVSVAGLKAIEAVLDDSKYILDTVSRLRVERGRMYRGLRKLNFLHPFPSQGNYILCEVTRGDAHDVHHRLEQEGILVRKYSDADLRNHLRISVGKPEHTDALMNSLRAMATEV